jgi:hypothetical protein
VSLVKMRSRVSKPDAPIINKAERAVRRIIAVLLKSSDDGFMCHP